MADAFFLLIAFISGGCLGLMIGVIWQIGNADGREAQPYAIMNHQRQRLERLDAILDAGLPDLTQEQDA